MNDFNSTPLPPSEESQLPMQTMASGPVWPGSRPPPPGPPAFTVERYLSFLKRKWWVLLLTVLVFGGLAAAYIQWWPVVYASKAHVWMAGKMRLREGALYDDQAQNFGGTQVELLQTHMIQRRALTRLRDTLHIAIPTNSSGEITLVKLNAEQISRSSIVELMAMGPTEAFTEAFLNAAIEEFLAYKKEVRESQAGDTYTSVTAQINREETELKAAQDKMTTYMKENNVAILEEQAKSGGAYLTKLLTEFSQLELEYKLLEASVGGGVGALEASTNASASLPSLRRASDAVSSTSNAQSVYAGAQQEIEKLKLLRERFGKYFRPKHPKMAKLDEQIALAERLVGFFSHQNQEDLARSKREVKVRMESVQQTIKAWEVKVGNASERIAQGQKLKLNVDRLQSFYDHLLILLQSVDVSRNLEQENITVLDRASPAKPKKRPAPLVAAVSLLFGIFSGLGLVLIMERFDDRVTSVEEIGWSLGERILGQVPESPGMKRNARPPLLELDDDRHLLAESYRSLRSALLFGLSAGEEPRVLLVTSTTPHEGKSTLAANLARTLAFAGSRVLLVDADLRCGLLHELFGVAQGPGLADLLAQGGGLKQFAVPTSVNNLYLIPRGQSPENAGELLLGPACDRFLERARQEYDRVIIDSIPVFAADDTTSLAPRTDGVIFVVRDSFTRIRTARLALEMLYDRQAEVLGLVFNRAKTRWHSNNYYKYQQYYGRARAADESPQIKRRRKRVKSRGKIPTLPDGKKTPTKKR
jgi:capsular exopolysaccharide synthesis family protein